MKVDLAYGHNGLTIELPESTDVVQSNFIPGLDDEAASIRDALRHPIASLPLSALVDPGDTVVIVHSDITRPTPNDRILPLLLTELEEAGIRRPDITLLNALGTHRPQTESELRTMLGEDIVDNYRCLQHNAFNDAILTPLGTTGNGNTVRINQHFLDADVRILTGFIEPHFFAGFSGGPKGVLPALAGAESVLSNHSRTMIGDENATWGITEGNPIWEEMREVAQMAKPTFLLNVTLNAAKEISGVFAGEMLAAHAAGCNFVRQSAMIAVNEPYDIVVTTNSGYPLDQNLYQTVKGMSAAQRIVRKGGAIIMAGACQDGLPDHGRYAELLAEAGSPQGVLDMLARPGFGEQDQWQIQIQAQIQLYADVYVYSDGLSDGQIRRALLTPCPDIQQTVKQLMNTNGGGTRVCALPEGPQTIPYLTSEDSPDTD